MSDDFRIRIVREALDKHVASPSLDHIRDAAMLDRLAAEIVAELFRGHPIWRKWDLTRETFLRRAIPCWIPIEDLTAFLNEIEGPILTTTDVQSRMDMMCEDRFVTYPSPSKIDFCLAIYNAEKASGTEVAAIVQRIADRCAEEEMREYDERRERRKRELTEAAAALEARFLSGADCKWTPITGHEGLYCRVNGRAFRLTKDEQKKHLLHRVTEPGDCGTLIGRYASRADASRRWRLCRTLETLRQDWRGPRCAPLIFIVWLLQSEDASDQRTAAERER